jgi:Zn-finger nucleic acid-binding protein
MSRKLVCPACSGEVEVVGSGSVDYDRCRRCGGVWLDRGELEQLIAIAYRTGKQRSEKLELVGVRMGRSGPAERA